MLGEIAQNHITRIYDRVLLVVHQLIECLEHFHFLAEDFSFGEIAQHDC